MAASVQHEHNTALHLHQEYQPVSQTSGLDQITDISARMTPWMLTNQPNMISAWEFNPNIDDLLKNDTVNKIKNFMDLDTIQASKSTIRQFIESILKWLGYDVTAEGLFMKRMQKELDSGCCHGISMALMGALLEAESSDTPIDIDELFRNLPKEDIVTLQVLANLQIEVYKLTKLRRTQLTDSIAQRSGSIPTDAQNKNEEALQTKIREGQGLVKAIDDAIIEISGFKFSETKSANTALNIESYLADTNVHNNHNAKFVISFCAPKTNQPNESIEEAIPGHSVVVDLKNFIFFDINGAAFQYSSKQECIQAVRARVEHDYKEYNGGTWIMRVVRPAIPDPRSHRTSETQTADPSLRGGKITQLVKATAQFASVTTEHALQDDINSPPPTAHKKKFHLPNPFKRKKKGTVKNSESDSD